MSTLQMVCQSLILHDHVTYHFIAGGSPIMGYVAACSLLPQAGYGTLDLQAGTLISAPTQTAPQSWKLWSSGTTGPSDLIATVS